MEQEKILEEEEKLKRSREQRKIKKEQGKRINRSRRQKIERGIGRGGKSWKEQGAQTPP